MTAPEPAVPPTASAGPPGGWGPPGVPPPPPGTPPPPPPPPGPGVQPPFVAAPVEGRQARMWLRLGVAGGLLAACCGIGGVAVGGLVVLGQHALNEQAQRAVRDYLEARRQEDWERAYELRCEADQRASSLPEFIHRVSTAPRIQEYEIGDLQVTSGDDPFDPDSGELDVPVTITYVNGDTEQFQIPLAQNTSTGE